MVELGNSNPQISLGVIVRGGTISASRIPRVEAGCSRGYGMGFVGLEEGDIVVTQGIDQSSRNE